MQGGRMSAVDYSACLANLEAELRKAEAKLVEATRWVDQLEHDVAALKLRGFRVENDTSAHLDFALPNESELRGLVAMREFAYCPMEPDDSQQYIDDCAALAWLDRAISAASSSDTGAKR